jgi:hypothetical protein
MIGRIQGVKDRVIVAAADGHKVIQAAILSETQAPAGCKVRYPWHWA